MGKDTCQWSDPIRKNKILTIYPTLDVAQYKWSKVFDQAIKEFNNLKLGVAYRPVGIAPDPKEKICWKGTNVQFDACLGTKVYKICNQELKGFLDGKGLIGQTVTVPEYTFTDNKPKIETRAKAFIMVPATPMLPDKSRLVGDQVKLVIAVHELIHACGLNKHSDYNTDVMGENYSAKAPMTMLLRSGRTMKCRRFTYPTRQ
jgi:hypothetical protein